MKTVVKGPIRDEKGYVLITVLILLVVGGLILTPLLGLMSTGLLAGQVYEKKMQEYYAADAGIEDALWKIQHGIDIPQAPDGYNLTVNNKYVWVTISSTGAAQFLIDLLDEVKGEKNWVHSPWMVTYRIPVSGTFSINITWTGTSQNKHIDSVGAWLAGTYSYVEGQDIPEGDIRAAYPYYTFDSEGIKFRGGTAFMWEWSGSDRPTFSPGDTMNLTFQFTPADTPPKSIGWVIGGSEDVGLVYDGDFSLYKITAIATTDTSTATADIESQTTVVANAVPRGCAGDEIEVLNWNIS
jgi:hypothetical protein